MIKKFLYAVVAIIFITITSSYVLVYSNLKTLDAIARSELGGLYLHTEQGVLSYTRDGSESAPVVILVHGFSTPKFVWEQIIRLLPLITLAAAFQIVRWGLMMPLCTAMNSTN